MTEKEQEFSVTSCSRPWPLLNVFSGKHSLLGDFLVPLFYGLYHLSFRVQREVVIKMGKTYQVFRKVTEMSRELLLRGFSKLLVTLILEKVSHELPVVHWQFNREWSSPSGLCVDEVLNSMILRFVELELLPKHPYLHRV